MGYDPPAPSVREVVRSCVGMIVGFALLCLFLAGVGQFIVSYWQQ